VLAVAASALVVATAWPKGSGHVGAKAKSCSGAVTLPVIAAPSIAPAITTIATDWVATHPASGGVCVRVAVTAQDSRKAEQALAHAAAATVWIPDSSVWSSKLSTDSPAANRSRVVVGPSIAKSPLVVAAAPSLVAAVAAAGKTGWAGALSAGAGVALPSPTDTTEGALALLGMQAQLGTSAAGADTLGNILLQLTARVTPNTSAGFSAVKDYPASAPAFVASEQQVLAINDKALTPLTYPVFPSGVSPALDYPLVTITPNGSAVYAHALQQFEGQLTSPSATNALHVAHLRDVNATPFHDMSGVSGAGNAAVTLAPRPTVSGVTDILHRWATVDTANQFLAVVDVSGSMKDPAGNGQSKIQTASQATATAMTLMPDTWSVGLWTFSLKPPPANDWTELVPLGSVQTQRAALLTAAGSMPARASGDTGLYSTALAAFQTVTAQYAANKTNSVVLLTDGANVDPDDSNLPTLLAKLKAARDPRRPVSIITIALGKDADVHALQQISAATGGRTFVVRQAGDIRAIFVRIALRS